MGVRDTWGRLRRPDALGAVRRNGAAAVDRVWAPAAKRWSRAPRAPHRPTADPRVALVTVNLSTTTYLQLMLATLAAQEGLDLLTRVVIVDNGSRDDGLPFLRALATGIDRVTVVERHRFPSHAHGMRAGVAALRRAERGTAEADRATHLLFVDTDVIWRRSDALLDLVAVAVARDAALVGEVRTHGPNPRPDIQASLFLVRRDVYDDPAIPPLLNCGSPAYRLQQGVIDHGATVVDFPTNRGGYTLHRGRSGVVAAAGHPRHPYAKAVTRTPHFMGVADGARVWSETEAAHASLLGAAGAPALIELLAARLGSA